MLLNVNQVNIAEIENWGRNREKEEKSIHLLMFACAKYDNNVWGIVQN